MASSRPAHAHLSPRLIQWRSYSSQMTSWRSWSRAPPRPTRTCFVTLSHRFVGSTHRWPKRWQHSPLRSHMSRFWQAFRPHEVTMNSPGTNVPPAHILVVDDNTNNLHLLMKLLSEHG